MKQTAKKQYKPVRLHIMIADFDVITASLIDATTHDYGQKWGWENITQFKS